MEENRPLVEDSETTSAVLGRIMLVAGDLSTEWNKGVIQPLTNKLVAAVNAYKAGIEDQSVSPKELKQRELRYQRLSRQRDAALKVFDQFAEFVGKVQTLYNEKMKKEEAEGLVETPPDAPQDRPEEVADKGQVVYLATPPEPPVESPGHFPEQAKAGEPSFLRRMLSRF